MVNFTLVKKLHAPNGVMRLQATCQVQTGQLVSLYGASGAGKTSILRMLAGFMQPNEGEVAFNGDIWYSSQHNINVPPQKRNIGFVFQDYGLFPNMNVRQNLAFALPKGQPPKIIDELLAATGLRELQQKKIQSLSGGQKQRIALARALVRKPQLLLLDEPLSAIDNQMREHLQYIIAQMHRRYGLTTLLVTHNIPEIIKLCDKTIWLEGSGIKEYAPPAQMFYKHLGNGGEINGVVVECEPSTAGFIASILIGDQIIKKETELEWKKGEKVVVKIENGIIRADRAHDNG